MDKQRDYISSQVTHAQDRHQHRDINRQHEPQKQGALHYMHPKLLIV